MRMVINPEGWPCSLEEAPAGPFVTLDKPHLLCFKSEYHHDDGRIIAYNSAGEFFCTQDARIQPVSMNVERDD